MADEAASGVPLVGSRISLISKKNIRYEGVLYNINTSDASLALQNGKCRLLCARGYVESLGRCASQKEQDPLIECHGYVGKCDTHCEYSCREHHMPHPRVARAHAFTCPGRETRGWVM